MEEGRSRVAVIGGGLAGLVTAWMLDSTCDVTLFERSDRLGGHAHFVEGGYDLAAQFVSPVVQPTYWRLARRLGMRFLRVRGTAALRGPSLLMDSSKPWRALPGGVALGALLGAGRLSVPWDMTVREFLERRLSFLPLSVRQDVVVPWLASLGNCVLSGVLDWSAPAALAFMTRPSMITSAPYYNAVGGLGDVVARLPVSRVKLGVEVGRLVRSPQGIHVRDEVFDHVVLAVPSAAARSMVGGVLWRDLSGFTSFRSDLAVHRDPVYMPRDRRDWRAFNAVRSGDFCEASLWYGGLRGTHEQVFKSWTTYRDRQPAEVIASASYQHPVITPDTVVAQRRLASVQGRDGLWFAGSWTTDVDSQESAVVSAVRVATALGAKPF